MAGALASSVVVTSCVVDEPLDDRLWRCDEQAEEDECGMKDGRLMACWQGYCMSSCDPKNPPSDDGVECLSVGVLLEKCDPKLDDCPGKLNCYRRSLLFDEGVCVPFPLCDSDEDCKGGRRNSCAGQVLQEHLGEDADIQSDNFQCVEEGCSEGGCDIGETCLNEAYRVEGRYPDICLPKCDSKQRCMPNFACMLDKVAAPQAHDICVPGLPGVRCTSDLDCVVGSCVDLGVGFSICTGDPCTKDGDCVLMNQPPIYFVCAGIPGGKKYCVNPTPFGGAECNMKEPECPEETPECYDYSPSSPHQRFGECRRQCDPDGTCPARGGLPHLCLEDGDREGEHDGGCYPATFGLPCKPPQECIPPLECLEVEPDGREHVPSTHRCTLPCDGEPACDNAPVTGGGAYCGGGFCRIPGLTGAPCDHDGHCRSGRQCFFGTDGVGECVEEQ